MLPHPRGGGGSRNPFPNRGGKRGTNSSGSSNRGVPIIKYGKKELLNMSSEKSFFSDDSMFAEFLQFKKFQETNTAPSSSSNKPEGTNSTPSKPSYIDVTTNTVTPQDEDSLSTFEKKDHRDILMILEYRDLQWKNDPWLILRRYLDTVSYTVGSYKPRSYYENILITTGSCEVSHFYPSSQERSVFNFSKIIIKKIISIEEWGISSFKEKEFITKETKLLFKYNYWDYIQAFSQVFLYENSRHKHTWFIKVCPEVYRNNIPNWFFSWWKSYGPTSILLPDQFRQVFNQWVECSPKIKEAEAENQMVINKASIFFFMEFSIPWIWKWVPEVDFCSEDNIPCLYRTYYIKWWNKLLQMDRTTGNIEGQETLDHISRVIVEYNKSAGNTKPKEASSILGKASEKIRMRKGKISKADLLKEVLNMVQDELKDQFDDDDDIQSASNEGNTVSMETSSRTGNNQFDNLYQDAQDPTDDLKDLDAMIESLRQENQDKQV